MMTFDDFRENFIDPQLRAGRDEDVIAARAMGAAYYLLSPSTVERAKAAEFRAAMESLFAKRRGA